MTPTGSSGDLAADRRYQWAVGALGVQDFEAAREIFVHTLELASDWAPAWFGLGQALEALGRREEAAAAFGKALVFDPADSAGAGLRLAFLAGEAPTAAPPAYVRTLFDQYAATFDRHLVEGLAYRGPEILVEAIQRTARGRTFGEVIDLGCGAGLFGAAIRARARRLVGVDLSPAMIEQARGKGVYDRLAAADLVDFLAAERQASADLAAAADVFVYIGDLTPVFAAVSRVLTRGGLFAFTTQKADGESFRLGEDMRFAHSEVFLRACAASADFTTVELAPAATRKDRGVDVPGWVVILHKN